MAFDPSICDEMLEACIDELDGAIAKLGRYPATVLAFALHAHLAALLGSLLEHGLCTPQEARTFIRDLEADALQIDDVS